MVGRLKLLIFLLPLQGADALRDIFVTPPEERRVPGVIWKLKTAIYGLCDASWGWYKALSDILIDLGAKRGLIDPAVFLFYKEVDNEEEGLNGMIYYIQETLSSMKK